MALGDYGKNKDNNSKKNNIEPLVRLDRIGNSCNPEGVDPSALNYEFYNGMLKIIITPLKFGTDVNKKFTYDKDNQVEMWLTPVKAKIFHSEILYLLSNKDSVNNVGVCTTSGGLIEFSTGKELGASSECLIIRKITEEGEITSTYAYQFRNNPNNIGIRNFNDNNTSEYDRIAYPNTEVEFFLSVLKEFYTAMTGAQAYANMYFGKYDYNRISNKINLIMDKLGIEKAGSGDYSRKQNNFFNGNSMNPPENAVESKYDAYGMLGESYEE